MIRVTKKPGEGYRQAIDFAKGLPPNASIVRCAVSQSKRDDGELSDVVLPGDADVSGTFVRFMAKGGDSGRVYKVVLGLDLSTGERMEEDIEVAVLDEQVSKAAWRPVDEIAKILVGGIEKHNANPAAADAAYLERASMVRPLPGKQMQAPPLEADGSLKGTEKK